MFKDYKDFLIGAKRNNYNDIINLIKRGLLSTPITMQELYEMEWYMKNGRCWIIEKKEGKIVRAEYLD